MQTIKITSKRQATLPERLCREMGVGPGDRLIVQRHFMNKTLFWSLRRSQNTYGWLGVFKKYAKHKSHDIQNIRASIGRAGKK